MQHVNNNLILQKMLGRVPGEVLSRICLMNNESSWKSQEATPRHTNTHTLVLCSTFKSYQL